MTYQKVTCRPVGWRRDPRLSQRPASDDATRAATFLEQWQWIRAAIAEALRPHPEALAAVVEALSKWDSPS
ncbi:MAG: hypothetical protein JSU00_04075 [Acidobacteria bacterium]|nr:hypothetical protein [Acidobacteriota bacterium]